jgi:hypothetical protein
MRVDQRHHEIASHAARIEAGHASEKADGLSIELGTRNLDSAAGTLSARFAHLVWKIGTRLRKPAEKTTRRPGDPLDHHGANGL